ncbi:DUF1611 domain-containing protein [Limnoraphis robusta Tam1]|uniref:DUF1611 domain-containing protein n=1 Tax=Limnoraphis robusta CCNP1315 TaxID=3110306 RepID=A0ABU5U7J2_9CYAN|nr:DUF1611 domain-containing protein [Limnoraphis robusta]MEA5523015.1 DUF1611 domain-containing protein [Limnoraphis robusta CCNP1315]MEA5539561.1 DUF1611 domain-containing protein [Limnoraphis robusta Tam1]MEA5546909.1 DUF1611 domain-containing protein [Limnoraphis robusta CCNP1324]
MTPENPQSKIQAGRLAILLHEGILGATGKTGLSLLRYSQANIVAVIDRDCAGKSLSELTGINRDVPIVASLKEALAYNPNILMIGIAPSGGALPEEWWLDLDDALEAGLSIVNGLHTKLIPLVEQRHKTNINQFLKPQQWIWDIRQEPPGLKIASAAARQLSCRRVLTVGTDMAIGKMSTGLELNKAAQKRGIRSKFIATGQGGLMLGEDGIPLDSVRVDFAAGAVEQMVMRFGKDCDLLIVEGQGSLIHPGSTATLPLLRGSQPTDLILAHRAGQTHIRNHPHVVIPPLSQVIELYEKIASVGGAMQSAKIVGISLNTYGLAEDVAREAIAQIQSETGLPCTDTVRFGASILLDALLISEQAIGNRQ